MAHQREGTVLIIDGVRYQEADARKLGLIKPAATEKQESEKPAPKQKARRQAANKARTSSEDKSNATE